jgi:hypothetical protein
MQFGGKNLHITIITTIALILVGIYLYFTISDVKKLALEVVNLKNTNKTLATSLTTLAKELQYLKDGYQDDVDADAEVEEQADHEQEPEPEDVLRMLSCCDESAGVCEMPVKKEVEDEPEEEDVQEIEADDEHKPEKLDEEQVKSMKYEDLKKYCQQHCLSYKGNKTELVSRVLKYIAA